MSSYPAGGTFTKAKAMHSSPTRPKRSRPATRQLSPKSSAPNRRRLSLLATGRKWLREVGGSRTHRARLLVASLALLLVALFTHACLLRQATAFPGAHFNQGRNAAWL